MQRRVTDSDLVKFIRAHIASVAGLEILMLLKQDPEKIWSTSALVSELRSSTLVVRRCLEKLVAAGLVAEAPGGHRFAPGSEELGITAEAIAAAFKTAPATMISVIMSERDSQLQLFADAFRLKE